MEVHEGDVTTCANTIQYNTIQYIYIYIFIVCISVGTGSYVTYSARGFLGLACTFRQPPASTPRLPMTIGIQLCPIIQFITSLLPLLFFILLLLYCILLYFNSCAMLLSNRVAGTSRLWAMYHTQTNFQVFKQCYSGSPKKFNWGSKLIWRH